MLLSGKKILVEHSGRSGCHYYALVVRGRIVSSGVVWSDRSGLIGLAKQW